MKQKVTVVLGMHKSGTSLISSMLHHSGINMVEQEDAKTYDQKNHYERLSTNKLNKQLLGCGTKSSLSVVNELDICGISSDLDYTVRATVENIRIAESAWGFKDPRTCLTYQYWKQILPDHRIVGVFRSPYEVHAHYTKKRRLDPLRGVRAIRAWQIYNSCLLKAVESSDSDHVLINYGKLMTTDQELKKLERFLECELVDKRDNTLRRAAQDQSNRFDLDNYISEHLFGHNTLALYQRLLRLSA